MNLVIDTNIVFSAILNPKSNIGDILVNYQDKINFYAPEFLLYEIAIIKEFAQANTYK